MKKEIGKDMKRMKSIDFERQTRVLLEDIQSKFQLLAEGHTIVISRLDKVEGRLGAVESRLGSVESEMYTVKMAVLDVGSRLSKVENKLAIA